MRAEMQKRTASRFAALVLSLFAAALASALLVPCSAIAAPAKDGYAVYGINTTTPQFRNYAVATNTFGAQTATVAGAIPTWMVTRSAPTRQERIAAYVTTGGQLYVMRYNGSTWSNEWGPVAVGGNGVDGRRFDIAYENSTGRCMVVYSTTATGQVAYRIWNGTTWTAAVNQTSARLTAAVGWIKLLPRPGTNEIALTMTDIGTTTGNNADLTTLIWSGSAWASEPAAAHSTTMYCLATTQLLQNDLFDQAWESTSGDLMVVWTQSTPQQYWRAWTRSTNTWGTAASFGTGRAAPLQMALASDPNSNSLLLVFNRSASANVYGNVWTGAGWSVATATTIGTNALTTTAVNKKHVAAEWLVVGGTSYGIAMWTTGTAAMIGINNVTAGATWGTAGTQTFTGAGALAWMDAVVDPGGPDTLMLTFSDANNDLWAKRGVLQTAGQNPVWTNADGGAALTATLTNITTQNFAFDYDRFTRTTTIATGTDPTPAIQSLCPPTGTASAIDADAFTLQTNLTTDSVTSVTVNLGTNAWQGISSVQITSDNGLTIYGSATPTGDNVTISLATTPITANTTTTPYKVRVIPFTATAMPFPGAAYPVNARVTDFVCTYAKAGSDTAGTTITIDNASPADATWGATTPGNGQVILNWTNPASDFSQVVILRKGSAITEAPVEGTTYSAPGALGASQIVYVGSLQTFTDPGLTNGNSYYYKIFAKDACGNYSAGVQTGPLIPTFTTIATGSDPASTSLCPPVSPSALDADAFTLQTAAVTDTVTAFTVSLGTGAWPGIATVQITDDSGATVFGSVIPTSDTATVSLTTPITVTTTLTQYHVRVVPLAATAMPAPPGATYAVNARITGFTSLNAQSGSDTATATLTIDNTSPAVPTWGTITTGAARVTLNWTNPVSDFANVVILRGTATITDTPAEGSTYTSSSTIGASRVVYSGNATTFTDTTVLGETAYYYKIFAADACVNYSPGVQTGPYTVPVPVVSPLAGSATVDSCTQITVSAPFTGDSPAATRNSTTTIERGTATGGPWAAVTGCSNLAGASPRICVDSTMAAGSTVYYRATFTDPDGVSGVNPVLIGPYTTPTACAANGTTAGTATAQRSACKEITVTAPFTGDGNSNGSVKVEYNTANTWPGTVACATVSGGSPRTCLITTLNASTSYYVRVTYSDADGAPTGTNPQVIGPMTTVACAADTVPPTITFLSPARGAVLGSTERVKVQVWDAGGMGASPVQWSLDGGAFSTGAALNPNYSCGTNCGVYEFDLVTGGTPAAVANGSHYITIQATDSANNIATASVPFSVYNTSGSGRGAGTLLRRTYSSQLCQDCHSLQTHSSQSATTQYGNWAIDCLTCHTPHNTTNVKLVRGSIVTPSSGTAGVTFQADDWQTPSNPQNSYLGDKSGVGNAPYNDGVCETCHTKTTHHRNDTSGGDHTHYAGERCAGCHRHEYGFKPMESAGGWTCSDCHPAIFRAMSGKDAKTSKHSIGGIVKTNDAAVDNGTAYTVPLRTSTTPSQRLCLSCHQDHVHNAPGQTVATATHNLNVHTDASTQTSRAVTRGAGGVIVTGTPASTDFDNAATNGGMCISCHRSELETGGLPIDKAGYGASAHNYTSKTVGANTYNYIYTQHDGTNFNRNCTKCHADQPEAAPGAATTPFGAVHFSSNLKLLAGSRNPNNSPAAFICYNCHGNATTGTDRSGKDVATQIAKTYAHPANADAVHDGSAEYRNASFGNMLGASTRHGSCMDCHDQHDAKTGLHTARSNLAGPALQGAWGAQLSTNPALWTAPTSANFTKKVITSTDLEATVCFKCHSSYFWGTGAPPNGLSPNGTGTNNPVETDVAMEFNPANRSGHPVLASLNNYTGSPTPKALTAAQLSAPWNVTANLGNQVMTCSDCHNTDAVSPAAQGPHGSAVKFMLAGTNKYWPENASNAAYGLGTNPTTNTHLAGLFCLNCHPMFLGGTNSAANWSGNNVHYNHSGPQVANVLCYRCHIMIPHGGKVSRLIATNTAGLPARYAYANSTANVQVTQFRKAAGPGSYATGNCNTSCGGHNTVTTPETW